MELLKLWQGEIFNSKIIFSQVLPQISVSKHNLSRHVLRHLEEGKTFPCNFCGKESRSSNGLSQHIVKRHSTGTVLSDFDQKVSAADVDKKDAFDHEMEEIEKEEDNLEIDLEDSLKIDLEDSLEIDLEDVEEGGDSVENQSKEEENGSTDQSKREMGDFKEKIEVMIEKVIICEN